MKNRKIMLIFVTMIILVIAVTPIVKASNSNPLNIIDEEDQNNDVSNNDTQNTNNETPANNETPVVNNEPNTENTNVAENNLPQTGVAEDTTLFIFIAICLVSAIYAYTKIRNYRNI